MTLRDRTPSRSVHGPDSRAERRTHSAFQWCLLDVAPTTRQRWKVRSSAGHQSRNPATGLDGSPARAPTSGVLATAGGIVFAGALDRWFTAYDARTGVSLWKIRLSDVPNSAPISYLANGKQYVAVVVGAGIGQAAEFPALVPEIPLPLARSSAIWVFRWMNERDTSYSPYCR